MKKLFFILLLLSAVPLAAQKKITFKSGDGLEVTADLYVTNPENSPFIILFHQAKWSRGEYQEIAPKLNKMGFNCMAVDQRSGEEINGVVNETYNRAVEKGLATSYIDALGDMHAAIDYVKAKYKNAGSLIIWGSSYSSALVLHIASERKDISGVLAFSPGEYFEDQGKSKDWITQSAKKITVPTFITSAKLEKKQWWDIAAQIPEQNRAYFLPTKLGKHGSRSLWSKFSDSGEYWEAVKGFLGLFQ
ncbi:MAG: alpha/beta hydrolase [Flavobacteriales bacterium]|nr:alpha/beta hydrolase [Flavobacteriales bacterium]